MACNDRAVISWARLARSRADRSLDFQERGCERVEDIGKRVGTERRHLRCIPFPLDRRTLMSQFLNECVHHLLYISSMYMHR